MQKGYEQPILEVVKFDATDLVVNLASSVVVPVTETEHDVEGSGY